MNVIELYEYEGSAYRRELNEFYEFLDKTKLPIDSKVEDRKKFVRRMFGKFIQISKLKRHMNIEQILNFLNISDASTENIESGTKVLSDREFFMVITYLGCATELPVFLTKVENAIPLRMWKINSK